MPLNAFAGFAVDMDGTFFLGDRLLPGALEFISFLRAKGIPFRFLTNNSSKSSLAYVGKLQGLGLNAEDALIYSSGDACIGYLQQNFPGASVFLLGTPSLQESFKAAGIRLVEDEAQVAVLAFDTSLTYARLTRFCDLVRAGLPYISTHPDINCPVPGGYAPDAGAMMALVRASTGREPDIVLGKPNPEIMRQLAAQIDVDPARLVMVGDRLYTDIALGQTAGVQTVLVLSGEAKREHLAVSPYQPDLVCEDLSELLGFLRGWGSAQAV